LRPLRLLLALQLVPNEARVEFMRSAGGNPPQVQDPFRGGSIPLEAERLGVGVTITDLSDRSLSTRGFSHCICRKRNRLAQRPAQDEAWRLVELA